MPFLHIHNCQSTNNSIKAHINHTIYRYEDGRLFRVRVYTRRTPQITDINDKPTLLTQAIRLGRSLVDMSGMNNIPNRRYRHKSKEDNNGIIHGNRVDRNRNRHREKHHLEANPRQGQHIDNPPKMLSKRPRRCINARATGKHGEENRNAV